MDARVSLSVKDKVATILLNRPEAYNALDRDTAFELQAILLRVSTDPKVHGVVITGSGKAFSAGGDIRGVMAHPQGPAAAFNVLAAYVHVCIVEVRRMRKPVVAAINGVAAGGGFSLALASDFRVMARSARLKQGFTSNALSTAARPSPCPGSSASPERWRSPPSTSRSLPSRRWPGAS